MQVLAAVRLIDCQPDVSGLASGELQRDRLVGGHVRTLGEDDPRDLDLLDCLPGVASYVGADITAGVLSAGIVDEEKLTLFLDVGTNGETVLGTREWLVTCACSAGPAFEGAGVIHGMRATNGAIEEVWINGDTYEPSYRVIGGGRPRGLCGSGLISLISELFLTGVIDNSGGINTHLDIPRIRSGDADAVLAARSHAPA